MQQSNASDDEVTQQATTTTSSNDQFADNVSRDVDPLNRDECSMLNQSIICEHQGEVASLDSSAPTVRRGTLRLEIGSVSTGGEVGDSQHLFQDEQDGVDGNIDDNEHDETNDFGHIMPPRNSELNLIQSRFRRLFRFICTTIANVESTCSWWMSQRPAAFTFFIAMFLFLSLRRNDLKERNSDRSHPSNDENYDSLSPTAIPTPSRPPTRTPSTIPTNHALTATPFSRPTLSPTTARPTLSPSMAATPGPTPGPTYGTDQTRLDAVLNCAAKLSNVDHLQEDTPQYKAAEEFLLASNLAINIPSGPSCVWDSEFGDVYAQLTTLQALSVTERPRHHCKGKMFSCNDQSQTTAINLNNVYLQGSIPPETCGLKHLELFSVYANQGLTGAIPSCLGELQTLQYLKLHRTSISGSVPAELGQLYQLRELHLHETSSRGEMPSSVCALRNTNNGNLTILNAPCYTGSLFTCPHPGCCTSCKHAAAVFVEEIQSGQK